MVASFCEFVAQRSFEVRSQPRFSDEGYLRSMVVKLLDEVVVLVLERAYIGKYDGW